MPACRDPVHSRRLRGSARFSLFLERIESKMSEWDIHQAPEASNTTRGGGGYFDIGPDGHLLAYPDRDTRTLGIGLARVADEVRAAGLALPVVVRFVDILHDRVNALCDAFARAIE